MRLYSLLGLRGDGAKQFLLVYFSEELADFSRSASKVSGSAGGGASKS
jgi:hypothetical protein